MPSSRKRTPPDPPTPPPGDCPDCGVRWRSHPPEAFKSPHSALCAVALSRTVDVDPHPEPEVEGSDT